MSPEPEIAVIEDGGAFRWELMIGAEVVAQSPTGVTWPTEEECREAATTACRLAGFAVGLIDANDEISAALSELPESGVDAPDVQTDPDVIDVDPVVGAVILELCSRTILPAEWPRRMGLDLTAAAELSHRRALAERGS